MNWLDVFFLIVLGGALVRGCFRGLVMEFASILGIVVGFFFANAFSPLLGPLMHRFIVSQSAAQALSYVAVLLIVFVAILLLSAGVRKALAAGGLGGLDRVAGGLFGLLKGGLVCGLVLILLTAVLPAGSPTLAESKTSPFLLKATRTMVHYLPQGLKQAIQEKATALKRMWDGEESEKQHRNHTETNS